MRSVFLFLILFLTTEPVWAQNSKTSPKRSSRSGQNSKYTVCTVTINSDDEKKVFQKYLKQKDFEFVELTEKRPPPGEQEEDDSEGWFDSACRSGVQCDILLVSGHFGGGFFGDKNVELSLLKLQRHSCAEDCPGILKSPKEVFLMGCNTLAEKEKDSRTPEQYLRVLLDDGIPRSTAERVVEARYGVFSTSFKSSMRRVFAGVPHLYGFSSIGPSGNSVKGFLSSYFKSKKDYGQHLDKIATKELVRDLDFMNKNQGIPENFLLKKALRQTAFAQCSGIIGNDPEAVARKNICILMDDNVSRESKLKLISNLMQGKDYLQYFFSIHQFFKRNPPNRYKGTEVDLFKEIQANSQAKESFEALMKSIKTSTMRVDIATLVHSLQWMNKEELANLGRQMFLDAKVGKDGDADMDLLNYVATRIPEIQVSESDLPTFWKMNKRWIQFVGRVKVPGANIQSELLKIIVEFDKRLTKSAVNALARLTPLESTAFDKIAVLLRSSDLEPTVRAGLYEVLSSKNQREMSRTSESVRKLIFDKLSSKNRHEQREALRAVESLRMADNETLTLLTSLAQGDQDTQMKNEILMTLSILPVLEKPVDDLSF
ncbi:MAG: hypothetical protein A2428_01980 [Bdellovibrionales bacterium RIFOXYC1_FULL_54_43]|nr:MAG: hypothetical protein A2428_01980 [Bdellovibrionales bacterium RIFOXYC1_FULL_54_43]OFZ81377.1 MAG: hypothetical protein A3K03_05495 [Bdellovibrionales bacterium RIFOXYD1_FULL_44_7]